jgi:hypothetical protein
VQDLDGDVAIEPRIAGAVDLAHAAGADEPDDLVRPETVTCRERHERIISGQGAKRQLAAAVPRQLKRA